MMNNDYALQAVISLLETLTLEKTAPDRLDEALRCILEAASNVFDTELCVIAAINPISREPYGQPLGKGTKSPNEKIVLSPLAQATLRQKNNGIFIVNDTSSLPPEERIFHHLEETKAFAAVLMRSADSPLAVLYIGYEQPREFDVAFETLLRILADKATLILKHTWSHRRYQVVAQIGKEINQALGTVESLFLKLSKRVAEILDTSYFFMLAVHNQQADKLDYYVLVNGEYEKQSQLPVRGICSWVIKKKKAFSTSHLSEEMKRLPTEPVDMGFDKLDDPETLIFMPLLFRERCLGVLSIQALLPHAYSDEDQNILKLLGHHVAMALNTMRLFGNLDRLNQTGQLLIRELDSAQVFVNIVEQIREITRADIISLYPYDSLSGSFAFPPHFSGQLKDPSVAPPNFSRPDDIATLALSKGEVVYAHRSRKLFTQLGGDSQTRLGNFEEREKIRSTAAIPLRAGDETVGVLFINYRQPQRFDAPQRLLIESLASYAALAIKNSRQFDEFTKRRIREFKILRDIDRQVSETLNLGQVMQKILELTVQYLALRKEAERLNAAILIYNEHTNELEVKAAHGPTADSWRDKTVKLSEERGMTYWVFRNKKPARAGHVVNQEKWRKWYMKVEPETVSELDVPLLDESRGVIGILNYESNRENAFSQEDQDFLATVADRAVVAIKNAQLYERERRLVEELRALHEIDQKIIMQLDDPDQVMRMVLVDALTLTGAEFGDLHLYEGNRLGTTYFVERKGDRILPLKHYKAEETVELPRGIVKHVLETRKVYRPAGDAAKDPYYQGTLEVHSEVAVPLISRDELIGILNLESTKHYAFNDEDIWLLQLFTGQAVIAIQKARTYARAEEESSRFRWLSDAGRELGEISDLSQLEEAYEIIIRIVGENNEGQAVIRRYNPETGELLLKKVGRAREINPFEVIEPESVRWLLEREERTVVIPRVKELPPGTQPKISDPAINSLVITRIEFRGKFYGILALSHEEEDYFKEADVKLMEGLAQQLVVTIHRLETAQAQQEAELRANEVRMMSEVGKLAYEVTHRLGNDLPHVVSRAARIRQNLEDRNSLNKEVEKYLRVILDKAEESLAMTKKLKKDVIGFAEEGKIDRPRVVIPTERLLGEALQTVEFPSNVETNVEVSKGVADLHVVLQQVVEAIYNILINAIEALPDGGLISIRAFNDERHVKLEIEDNGPGIPSEDKKKIFNLFYTKKKTGSGFGLWNSRLSILSNGGDLTVESEIDKGAKFIITLPKA